MRKSADERIFDGVLTALAFVIALVVMIAMQAGKMSFFDFNLHYFAGVQERHGSYTELTALFSRMDAQHVSHSETGVYGTPTLVGLIFQPLSFLSLHAAHIFWDVLCSIALVVSMKKAAGGRWWIGWFALAVLSPAMLLGLQLQNLSVLTFCMLAYCFGAIRDKQWRTAGVVLGAAIALKLYPAFLLIALVILGRRCVKTIQWAIGTVFALSILTVPVLGIHDVMPAVQSTLELAGFVHDAPDNVGLPGFFVHHGAAQTMAKAVNLMGVVAAFAVIAWRRNAASHAVFALAALSMLTVQSISWVEYFPLMILGPLVIINDKVPNGIKAIAWISFAMATGYARYLSIITNGQIPTTAQLYVSYTAGAVLLTSALVLVTGRSAAYAHTIGANDNPQYVLPKNTVNTPINTQ